jgi:hypothetical protein
VADLADARKKSPALGPRQKKRFDMHDPVSGGGSTVKQVFAIRAGSLTAARKDELRVSMAPLDDLSASLFENEGMAHQVAGRWAKEQANSEGKRLRILYVVDSFNGYGGVDFFEVETLRLGSDTGSSSSEEGAS